MPTGTGAGGGGTLGTLRSAVLSGLSFRNMGCKEVSILGNILSVHKQIYNNSHWKRYEG